jgi:hypothetical protein
MIILENPGPRQQNAGGPVTHGPGFVKALFGTSPMGFIAKNVFVDNMRAI